MFVFEPNHLSQDNLAAIFGVTTRCIMQWRKSGLPQHGTGPKCYYVWAEVLPWYVAYKAGLGDPRRALPKVQAGPRPGPNYFHALELVERLQEALAAEVGGVFKRRARKAPARKHKPRPAPVPRRPQLE